MLAASYMARLCLRPLTWRGHAASSLARSLEPIHLSPPPSQEPASLWCARRPRRVVAARLPAHVLEVLLAQVGVEVVDKEAQVVQAAQAGRHVAARDA